MRDTEALKSVIAARSERDEPIEIAATIYAMGESFRGDCLDRLLSDPDFWRRVPVFDHELSEPAFRKYLAVPDHSLPGLVGHALHLLNEFAAQSPTISDRDASNPIALVKILQTRDGSSPSPSGDDLNLVLEGLVQRFGMSPDVLMKIVRAWDLADIEQSRLLRWVEGSAVFWFVSILEGLDRESLDYYYACVADFRQGVLRPFLSQSASDRRKLIWRIRCEKFHAFLADDPVARCVLFTEAFKAMVFRHHPLRRRNERGRPARTALGITVAYAYDVLRETAGDRTRQSPKSIFGHVQFRNPQVRNAIQLAQKKDLYSILAVLLTAVISPPDEFYTATQIEELRRPYRNSSERKSFEYRLNSLT